VRSVAALALLASACSPAGLDAVTARQAGADAPPGARAPAAAFTDEAGRRVNLRDLTQGGMPTLAVFVDYDCAYLCGIGLPILMQAMHRGGLESGRDVALLALPIDARDSAADVVRFRRSRLDGEEAILLRGDRAAIEQAERALGYRAIYDKANDQFAHLAAVYVLAPDGRVSAVLDEFSTSGDSLGETVAAARHETEPPAPTQDFFSLCYSLMRPGGAWSGAITAGLQVLALIALAGLGAWIARLLRREKER
jgi:protein SCO1/2